MKRNNSLLLVSLFVGGLCAAYPGNAASAGRVRTVKKQELEGVLKEIAERKAEIERLRRQEGSLQKDIETNAEKRRESLAARKRFQSQVAEANARLEELQQKLGALDSARAGWQAWLGEQFLRYDRLTRLEAPYFGAQDLWAEEFVRNSIGTQVRFLHGLEGVTHRTGRDQEELNRRRGTLQARSESEAQEAKRRELVLAEKQGTLALAQARREAAFDDMRRLEESAEALNRLLEALDRKGKKARSRPAAVASHSLPWPVEGRPVVFFGKQRLAELDTWVIRQGIHIETAPGAAVRPVRAGTVLYAGAFRSYGQMVIVDHGSGLFTVYGSLSKTAASKGQSVDADDVLGWAGRPEDASAPAKGSMLYFEVRRDGQALDPIAWLEKR